MTRSISSSACCRSEQAPARLRRALAVNAAEAPLRRWRASGNVAGHSAARASRRGRQHARRPRVMKVTVERSTLLKSLGHVHRVVERRNTIPILSNLLLSARRGRAAAQGDRSRHRGRRDHRGRCRRARRDDGSGPYALRHRPQAAPTARRSRWRPPARPGSCCARAARASSCRPCPRAISPTSPPARWRIASRCPPAS